MKDKKCFLDFFKSVRIQVKKKSEGRNTEDHANLLVSILLSEWTQIFVKAVQSSSEFLWPGSWFLCEAILEQKGNTL